VILPGHGRPVPDGVSYLRRCRDKGLDRVDAVRDSLRPTAVSGWDVAALMTPSGADSGHWQRSLAESLSVLEHLEAHGSARSRVDDDGTRRWQAPRA